RAPLTPTPFPYTTLLRSALDLHGRDTGLLHEPHGRLQRLGGGDLVGAEGQVGDDEGAPGGAGDGGGHRHHLLHGDRQRGVLAEEDRKSTRLNSSHVSISY